MRRNKILRLYDHGKACKCSSCIGIVHLTDLSTKFVKVPALVVEDFLKSVHKGQKATYIHAGLWREYFFRFRQFAEAGYGKTFLQPDNFAEFQLMESIKRNLSTFAGFKANAAAEELGALSRLPLPRFIKEGKKVMERYNNLYLQTELTTSAALANTAAKWKDIQQRSFLYPNLRYETVGDDRVRASHRILDGKVYPIDHSIWNTLMPPNGWRCRCIVIQTDEPIQPANEELFEPDSGFKHNPGKTGKLFDEDHPYFDLPSTWKASMERNAEQYRAAFELANTQRLSSKFDGATLPVPGLPSASHWTKQGINKAISSTHTEQAIKNSLMTAINMIVSQLRVTAGQIATGPEKVVYVLPFLGSEFYFHFELVEGKYVFQTVSESL